MKVKLFGRELFSFSKDEGGLAYFTADNNLKKATHLPDFYTNSNHSSLGETWSGTADLQIVSNITSGAMIATTSQKPASKPKPPKPEITPKKLYQLKALNDNGFELKTDPKYVDEQLVTFKEKVSLYKDKSSDYRGYNEISSILVRLENRKKYPKHRKFFEEFPYTTTEKIDRLVKGHNHLRFGSVDSFMADMPKEAVDVMKRYTDTTVALCDKKPIFYIVANKKDFEKRQGRRDPILVVQSPFAHVWQILGAWDEEMMLLDDL